MLSPRLVRACFVVGDTLLTKRVPPPDLPFIFPAQLLRHYPAAQVELPTDQLPPAGMPTVAWSDSIELKEYADLEPMEWTGTPGTVLPPVPQHAPA